jgi:UDP-N-acetylglucosamine 1-carboxyvinyltransferase
MLTYTVRGGRPLAGSVRVAGAKNAALPLVLATVVAGGPCRLRDVPDLSDVRAAVDLVCHLGVAVARDGDDLWLDPSGLRASDIPPELAGRLRMSVTLLGPLLARCGHASTASPGGCEIGARPIDFHLMALRALGATVREAGGRITCRAVRLRGAEVRLPLPSVGATEHLLTTGALAEGETVIVNAAREPEVVALAEFLTAMGARISGAGTPVVRVRGGARLGGAELRLPPDRIEAGTFLLAAAATGGEVTVAGARADHLGALLAVLTAAGCRVTAEPAAIRLAAPPRPRPVDVATGPYPAFPTDLQNPALAWLLRAEGTCRVTDRVFPERFAVVPEFRRMGAQVELAPGMATIRGVPRLRAAELRAGADLRGAAALVLAALAAEGPSRVVGADVLARGYARFAERLRGLGADVTVDGADGANT